MSAPAATVRLHLEADPAPELTERVCRLLRHRGAVVVELTVSAADPVVTRLDVRVRVADDVENLARQLSRLADVRTVEVRHDEVQAGDGDATS